MGSSCRKQVKNDIIIEMKLRNNKQMSKTETIINLPITEFNQLRTQNYDLRLMMIIINDKRTKIVFIYENKNQQKFNTSDFRLPGFQPKIFKINSSRNVNTMLTFIKRDIELNNGSNSTNNSIENPSYYRITLGDDSSFFQIQDITGIVKKIECDLCNKSNILMYEIINPKINFHERYHNIKLDAFQDNNISKNVDFNEQDQLNVFGLSNLGNTCYFNSSLQCILNCRYFTNSILNDNNNSNEKKEKLISIFYDLVKKIQLKKNIISPHEVLKEFRKIESKYNNSYQHDSPEFLSDFLNALSSQLNKVNQSNSNSTQYNINTPEDFDKKCKSKEDSIIKDLFYGHISNTYICNCNTKQINYEQFLLFHCPLNKSKTTINCYHLNSLSQTNKKYENNITCSNFKKLNKIEKYFILHYDWETKSIKILEDNEIVFSNVLDDKEKTTVMIMESKNGRGDFLFIVIPCIMQQEDPSNLREIGDNIYISLNCNNVLNEFQEIKNPFYLIIKKNNTISGLSNDIINKISVSSQNSNTTNTTQLSSIFNNNKGNIIIIYYKISPDVTYPFDLKPTQLSTIPSIQFSRNDTITLEDCLLLNKLCPNYSNKCKQCNTIKQLRIEIIKLPIYLIIFLKRGTIQNGKYIKLTNEVLYPETLNVYDYVDHNQYKDRNECEYELIAVNGHSGGVSGGHYIAIIKKNNQWYYISDSFVQQVKSYKINNALLLFYQIKKNN